MVWRWLLAIGLLAGSLWFANLALGNWWASGGPPTQNPEVYAFRGDICFVTACVLFAGFLTTIILNVITLRKDTKNRNNSASGA